MKRRDWKYSTATEQRFIKALQQLGEYIASAAEGSNTINEIVAAIESLSTQPWFIDYAEKQAFNMVQSLVIESANTWRKAAKTSRKSGLIYQSLRAEFANNARYSELIARNASLIKSLPQDIARQVVRKASNEAIAGRRSNELLAAIRESYPDIALYRARTIARTEIAKTQATVTQLRAEFVGVDYYIWRTVKDARVRSTHRHMEGVICSFTDPPSPELLGRMPAQGYYNPGQIYNCRCHAEPIIDLDDVSLPLTVYHNGRLQRMSKAKFKEYLQ